MAFLALAEKRHGRDRAEKVAVVRLAMHGEKKDVETAMKDWLKD